VGQLPATNANVLRLLLEVCHYINENAATTEMDALVSYEAWLVWFTLRLV